MGADAALGQTDGFNHHLHLVELQTGQSKALSYLLHHTLILWRIGLCILIELCILVALEVFYHLTCDKLHRTLLRGEAHKRTTIYKWRTRDTSMYLLGSIVEEHLHIVLELSAAHDRVVAEHHTLAVKQGLVRYELHLCHQTATALTAWSKAAWPCWCVFHHGTLVWNLMTCSIAQRHANTRIWNTAHAVALCIIILAYKLAIILTHRLYIDAIIVA